MHLFNWKKKLSVECWTLQSLNYRSLNYEVEKEGLSDFNSELQNNLIKCIHYI